MTTPNPHREAATRFTPGAWARDKFGEIVSLGKNGKSICMVLQDAEGEANACLIAAAPSLYGVLADICDHVALNPACLPKQLVSAMVSAMLKARGESA
jgi:hypothetical protein